MRRKAKLTLFILIIMLSVAYLLLTWWAAYATQRFYAERYRYLQENPFFKEGSFLRIDDYRYQRGLFSAQEEIAFTFNPLLAQISEGDEEKNKLFHFKIIETIHYGPLPLLTQGDFSLLKAASNVEINLPPEAAEKIKTIFGQDNPFSMSSRFHFDGSGNTHVHVAPFNYKELLANLTIAWQGLDIDIDYAKDFANVDTRLSAPGLMVQLEDDFHIKMDGMRSKYAYTFNADGLALGTQRLSVNALDIAFLGNDEDEDDGNFSLQLQGIQSKTHTQESSKAFIDSSWQLDVAQWQINKQYRGLAKIVTEIKHIHAPTLAALLKETEQLKPQWSREKSGEIADKLLVLLSHKPQLIVQQLLLKLPEGDINFKAKIDLVDTASSARLPEVLLKQVRAQAKFVVDKAVIQQFSLQQAREMIAADTEDGQPIDNEALESLARRLMDDNIKHLITQKVVLDDGEHFVTEIFWQQGKLYFNGKPASRLRMNPKKLGLNS